MRCSDQRSEQLFTINYNIFCKIVWLSVNKTDQIFRLNWYVAFLVCKSPEDVATTTKANITSDLVVDFQSDHRSNVLTKCPALHELPEASTQTMFKALGAALDATQKDHQLFPQQRFEADHEATCRGLQLPASP